MSILKGILHHWNKTSSAYDTIHPETEVAQVTDWNTGIVNTLASTGLSSLVNVLSSDSLLALLIKKVFDATGVKYSLGQNGYVCFGSLVGGLIIQWGNFQIQASTKNYIWQLPLGMKAIYAAFAFVADSETETDYRISAGALMPTAAQFISTIGTRNTSTYAFVIGAS